MAKQVSIIIPVYNQLEYTKKCLESIFADNQRCSYELIIIDNASQDGTKEFFETYTKEIDQRNILNKLDPHFVCGDELIYIRNDENLGVAKAWNQGLRKATGAYIAILNNDIVVSHDWMHGLLWALDFHKLALISPFAQTGPFNYDLNARASRFTQINIGELWDDYDFCAILMPRETFEKIGFFDEGFLIGGYEDTDYAYRLKKMNFRYAVTGASFIHHFGSQTLGEFKRRGDKHVEHNLNHFIKKWGVDPRQNQTKFTAKLRRWFRRLKLHWDRM